jgi:ABC-type phosphate transport system substrate-binding protein
LATGFDGFHERKDEVSVVKNNFRKRVVTSGLLLAGVALVAIAFVSTSGATVPSSGVNCAADGKFDGRGATFQTRAQQAFIAGFTADVCGNVSDSRSNDMVEYNVYDGVGATPNLTGSGYGRKAASCRTDAFSGTDIPYNVAQITSLDGAAGTGIVSCNAATGTGFGTAFTPPYQPQNGNPSSYPNGSDATGNLMSFPVAGSAVAIGVNLKSVCPTVTSLNLTGAQISELFGGDILNWNDSRLQAGQSAAIVTALQGCTVPVTRVVRLDDSGTTQIFKNYLGHVDMNRASATCDPGNVWGTANNGSGTGSGLAGASPNYEWPNFTTAATGGTGTVHPDGATKNGAPATGTCSAIDTGDVNGNNGVINVGEGVVAGTVSTAGTGTVFYADLPDLKNYTGCTGTCPAIIASVRNSTNTANVQPSTASRANCSFGAIVPPPSSAVGLNLSDTWATNNTSGNRGDVTNTGTVYPICGVTFDLVFTGLSGATGTGPVSELTNDQRRAIYSFFTYILSSPGQANLTSKFYQALPSSLVDTLRGAFQAGF